MFSQSRTLPQPIHFFQIIRENTIQNGELRIPRSFVSKHWEGISNPILVVLPNAAKWEMKWEKSGVDVWLVNDWKKFAEFYSLYKDQFLMFKYEGNSQFEVRICHRSALEIEYPLPNGGSNGEEQSDDDSIEILGCNISSSHHRERSKSPLSYFHSLKKKKVNPTEEPNSHPSKHVETKCAQSSGTKLEKKKFCADSGNATRPKNKGERGMFSKCEANNNEEALEDTESSSALQRAKAFTSDNPWFIRTMKPSHLQRPSLTIPAKYITEQDQKEKSSVTLWVSEERTWSSNLNKNKCNGQIGITTAWKNFVEDNNLKLGDVCVFEKTECRGISFRVVIFRSTQESTPPLPQAYT